MSCQAAASTLNIHVSHQKGEEKNPYAHQSIAQKVLAYLTQRLGKYEQKSAMD